MSILSFIESLPAVMERRQVMTVVDQLKMEYDDTVAPFIDEVREAFAGVPMKSMLMKRMDTTHRRYVSFQGNSLGLILNNLSNIRSSFDIIEKDVKTAFSVQFTNNNMSFERANVLKFIEALAFYIRYARKFMLFAIAQESLAVGKATAPKWSAAESEWVDTNMDQFAGLYVTMSLPPAEFKSRIAKASNATVDPQTFQLAQQSLGAQKTDPLEMDGFSPRQNPFMMMGKFLAEMQVNRYHEAKEEFYGLQLRLQELKDLTNGEPSNPVIQKQIQAYEKRISEYEYEMRKTEEKAGLH
jgi:hypothetical protein